MPNHTWLQHGIEALDTSLAFGSTRTTAALLSGLAKGNGTLETKECNSTPIKPSTTSYSPMQLLKMLILVVPQELYAHSCPGDLAL